MANLENQPLEDQLDEIVAGYLKSPAADKPSLQQKLLAEYPAFAAELQTFFDSQNQFQRLASPFREAFSVQRGHPAGAVIGGYEILEEIARGGMGIVYKARSLTLSRIVALKMLRSGPLTSAADKQRFQIEAEAVANLDYPHIVPIYEVGEEDHPFFSMKWLPGGSLAQSMNRGSWSGSGKENQRRVLDLMIPVARAVHHAHTRGILHRDLKPGNILLDADGTPYVSDFGLAKRFSPMKPPPLTAPSTTTSRSDDTPSFTPLTDSGLIVGTPSYMAPEQASGKSGAASVASDVYSLGAILYELLTGRPPFRGESTWDTLRQLMQSDPQTIRSLNPLVDRDLETICHKCLHKDPAQRYASAADLAADLERFARGEPILARPVTRWERCWRWCRRNPALSAVSVLAVLSLLVVAVGGVLFGLREARHAADMEEMVEETKKAQQKAEKEHQIAEENRQEAETQKELAEANFRDAHQAVYRFSHNVSQELGKKPELLPLRKKLLESALDYYKKFLQQRADNVNLKQEYAEAFFQVGEITSLLGARTDSLQAYQKALQLYQKLHQAHPQNVDLWAKVASSHLNLGVQEQALVKHKDALASYQEALKLFRQLAAAHPRNPDYPDSAARAGNNLASLYSDLGDPQKSLEMFQTVVEERRKQLAADPNDQITLGQLALNINNLGVMQAGMGKTAEALKSFQEALNIRLELVKQKPENTFLQVALAASYRDVGMASFQLKKNAEGISAWQKALEIREKMALENPTVGFYQSDLGGIYMDFGSWHRRNKRYDKAIPYYAKARDIWDKLVALDSGLPAYRNNRANCDFEIAQLYGFLGKRQEEMDHYNKALSVQEKLVVNYPQQLNFQSHYARTLKGWGLALSRSDKKAAEDALRLALKHQKIAFDKAPGVINYRQYMDEQYHALSGLLLESGKLEEALDLVKERWNLWPKNGEELYNVALDLAESAKKNSDAKVRSQYENLTLETLHMAIEAGFNNRQQLLEEPAFQPLQNRSEFQSLLAKLKK